MVGDNKVSVRRAAKEIGKGYTYVKRLIRERKIRAWVDGGTEEKPRLLVDLEELKRARDNALHTPLPLPAAPVKRQNRKAFRGEFTFDPAVADL